MQHVRKLCAISGLRCHFILQMRRCATPRSGVNLVLFNKGCWPLLRTLRLDKGGHRWPAPRNRALSGLLRLWPEPAIKRLALFGHFAQESRGREAFAVCFGQMITGGHRICGPHQIK